MQKDEKTPSTKSPSAASPNHGRSSTKKSHDRGKKRSQVAHEAPIRNTSKVLCDAATQTADEMPIPSKCHKHSGKSGGPTLPPVQPSLCDKCSKSMLTYIALVQQFLEGVAKDISQKVDPLERCSECVKESLSLPDRRSPTKAACDHVKVDGSSRSKSSSSGQKTVGTSRVREHDGHDGQVQSTTTSDRFQHSKDQTTASFKTDSPRRSQKDPCDQNLDQHTGVEHSPCKDSSPEKSGSVPLRSHTGESIASQQNAPTQFSQTGSHVKSGQDGPTAKSHEKESQKQTTKKGIPMGSKSSGAHGETMSSPKQSKSDVCKESPGRVHEDGESYHQPKSADSQNEKYLSSKDEVIRMVQKQDQNDEPHRDHGISSASLQDSSPPILREDNAFDVLSNLYRTDQARGDISNDRSFWESIKLGNEMGTERITHEAFVTLARNNTEAMGCLVLGASLALCRTNRTLCVLVADGVSTDFMAPLSSVFHTVQKIRSLDSLGTTKLALLDQPELGISFMKLNIWRLEQFTKCVYLNYDTVVVQNCDELFFHEELSAVPDIGWPDCFNSAVFVFKPSLETFFQLLDFAEKHGSYDEGDQGLMNSYFQGWSQDIHKKLSFIYNLMANVSYTYTPAFRRFGRNVKIVQFIGTFKPWHVKFYSETGQIAPSSAVHPTYVQFIHVWLNVFRFKVFTVLSQEIQNFTSSQNIISVQDLLRFFPSVNDTELEFLLSPPSVRLRPFDRPQMSPTVEAIEKLRRSSSTPNLRVSSDADVRLPGTSSDDIQTCLPQVQDDDNQYTVGDHTNNEVTDDVFDDNANSDEVNQEALEDLEDAIVGNEPNIPGSAVGNYQDMMAWEQGRMDYQGNASSDTIIKRLHFLMKQPDRLI